MPRKSRRARRANAGELSQAQTSDLYTGKIPSMHGEPEWENDNHRRRAWNENREQLMEANFNHKIPVFFGYRGRGPGTRPAAWWNYDAPEPRPNGETESDYLRRHNLLGAEEIEYLKHNEQ